MRDVEFYRLVMLQEGPPGGRGRPARAHAILLHCGFRDGSQFIRGRALCTAVNSSKSLQFFAAGFAKPSQGIPCVTPQHIV